MTEQLDALIAAIEAGEAGQLTNAEYRAISAFNDLCEKALPQDVRALWVKAWEAYSGSLDAALALHAALLQNGGWEVWRLQPDGYGCNLPGQDSAFSATPARALLLATLKGYRATMENAK